jgi:hypothetical protein
VKLALKSLVPWHVRTASRKTKMDAINVNVKHVRKSCV